MPRWPGKQGGMEKPKRARRRKPDTGQGGPGAGCSSPGGQGVRSDLESEGHEEKYRAVVNGGDPEDEQVGQRWGKVEPALWGEGVSHSPIAPRCLLAARYGRFTCDPRRPACVPASSRVSDPISGSEMGSDAHAGVGERNST